MLIHRPVRGCSNRSHAAKAIAALPYTALTPPRDAGAPEQENKGRHEPTQEAIPGEVPPSSAQRTKNPERQPNTKERKTIPRISHRLAGTDVPAHGVHGSRSRNLQPIPGGEEFTARGSHLYSEPPSLFDGAHEREDVGKPECTPPSAGSIKENPSSSLYWHTVAEAEILKRDKWQDKSYHACTLQGVWKRNQHICHDVKESQHQPRTRGRHAHYLKGDRPQRRGDSTSASQTSQGPPPFCSKAGYKLR